MVMTENKETYTYRAGKKVILEKEPDQFVVRALPETLKEMGIEDAEKVSSSSSRVTSKAADMEILMSMTRYLAPTHHAYRVAETGEEFLITDRVLVTFREAMPTGEVDAFAGKYGLIRLRSYSDRDYLFQLTEGTGMNPVKLGGEADGAGADRRDRRPRPQPADEHLRALPPDRPRLFEPVASSHTI
jgi:hypothetical protein